MAAGSEKEAFFLPPKQEAQKGPLVVCDLQKLRLSMRELRQHRRPVLVAVGCAVAQNMTAANSVVYFALDIFSLAGVCNAYLAGAGVGAMKVRRRNCFPVSKGDRASLARRVS